ncbi:MAG: hypothetical protein IJ546_00620 [Prevotella sp.]|nr:hypothetical protein [Prevotella sp.]MBR1521643.1 hypothetical protein [Bacteroidaceae bacterium]
MKKNIYYSMVVLLAGLLFGACSSDEQEETSNSYLATGTDKRPDWTVPADLYMRYEYTMSAQVTLQEMLLPYASADDLLCAIVDGEIRAVSTPQHTSGQIYFPLVVAGTSDSGAVSLCYYCARLSRIYTVSDWHHFSPELPPLQDDQPYVVNFIPE